MSYPILIVDQQPTRLERVRRLIESEGADTVVASNAKEAIRQFALRAPILTLLCVDLSDGIDPALCRELKSAGLASSRRVVAVGPRSARAASFDAGCDAF